MVEYKSAEFVHDSDDSSNEVGVEIPIKTITNTAPAHEKRKIDTKDAKPRKRKDTSTTDAKAGDTADATLDKLKKFVVACGVRKQWSKELQGMDIKQSTSHLRSLLVSLGMTGKMSMKQAKEIGAKRAFEKELEELNESKPHFKSPSQRRKSLTSRKGLSVVKSPSSEENNTSDALLEKEQAGSPLSKRKRPSVILSDDEE